MADEIRDANTIRTWRAGPRWYAEIGPKDRGLLADGTSGPAAIAALAVKCESLGWPFDPSWKPRG